MNNIKHLLNEHLLLLFNEILTENLFCHENMVNIKTQEAFRIPNGHNQIRNSPFCVSDEIPKLRAKRDFKIQGIRTNCLINDKASV